jgi:hypothetical protein
MTRILLLTSAILELGAAISLLAAPALLVPILLGGSLDAPVALVVARVAGAALLALGAACYRAGGDARSPAAIGTVSAMLMYNLAIAGLFVHARYVTEMRGIALIPAAALHVAMAVWCICSLRSGTLRERPGDHPA